MLELDVPPPDPGAHRAETEPASFDTVAGDLGERDEPRWWTAWLRWGIPCAAVVFCLSVAYFLTNAVVVPKRGDLDAIVSALGGSDSRWYVDGGRAILDGQLFSPENRWLVHLWPPGMFLYFAALIEVAALGLPLPVVVAGTMATLWSIALALWFMEIRHRANAVVAAIVAAVVVLGDTYRWWFFGTGLFFSEALTAALFLLATLAFLRSTTTSGRRSFALAGLAGVLLACTAYVRIVFEFMGLILTAWLVLFAVIAGVGRLLGRPSVSVTRSIVLLAIVVGAFHVVTVPWRLVAEARVRPGDYSWTAADDLYWHYSWTPDSYLAEHGWYWLIDGEINLACEIDAARCRQIAAEELESPAPFSGAGAYTEAEFEDMAMEVLRDHPFEWVGRKAGLVPRFWFVRPPGAGGPSGAVIAAMSAVAAITVTIVSIVKVRKAHLATAWWLSMVAASLGPLLLLQFEARYFYIVALTSPVLLAWWIGPMVKGRRADGAAQADSTNDAEAAATQGTA